MTILFLILILVASVVLSLFVLIQNPKGGGLSGNIAGFSSQFMGVKQTNDVLEKGTWIFAAVIAVLCIVSTVFISNGSSRQNNRLENIGTTPVPSQTAPAPNTGTFPAPAQQQPAPQK